MSSFEMVDDGIVSSTKSTPNATVNTYTNCDAYEQPVYETALSVVCSVLCLFGFIYTFFGYRCFKAVMFLSGLIFGGTVVYVICQEDRIFHQNLKLEIIIGIAVGIGVLCGFITMLIKYVGLFLQGFFMGLLVAIAGIVALQNFYNPSTPWIPVGILFGTGILFSLFTLKWQKTFVIISTGTMGGAMIVICVEYFVEKLLMLRYIWEALMAETSIPVCWYTWLLFGMWPLLAVIGCILQWKVTGKGYDHTDVVIWRGNRKRVRTHLVRNHETASSIRNRQHANESQVGSSAQSRRRRQDRSRSRERLNTRVSSRSQQQNITAVPADEPAPYNTDTLPPSYFDCVEKGIGKPVTREDQNKIVRTQHGSFIMHDNDQASSSGQHRAEPRARQQTRLPEVSIRHSGRLNQQNNSAAVTSCRNNNQNTQVTPTRCADNSQCDNRLRNIHEDQQSLLSSRSHASATRQGSRPQPRDALAVHARRIHEAQSRRNNAAT